MRYGTRLTPAFCALLVAAACSVGVAPAAGAVQVDRDQWASKFCAAFAGFFDAATSARTTVDDIIDNGVDANQVRDARSTLGSVLSQASGAATQAAVAIKSAGAPTVPNGAKINSTMITALDRASLVFSLAAQDVTEFSAKSRKFQASVKKLESDVDDELTKIGASVNRIGTLDKGGLIEAAISKTAGCASLQ